MHAHHENSIHTMLMYHSTEDQFECAATTAESAGNQKELRLQRRQWRERAHQQPDSSPGPSLHGMRLSEPAE